MIRRPPRSTQSRSSAASDVYKRQVIAMVAGWVIGRLKMERFIEDWVRDIRMGDAEATEELGWGARVAYAWQAVKDIVGKVWPYVVAGIAVGAAIHGYVPQNFMAGIMGKDLSLIHI